MKEKLSNVRTDIIEQATAQLADKLSNQSSTSIIEKGKGTTTVLVESTKKDIQKTANFNEVRRITEIGNREGAPAQKSATRTINAADQYGPRYEVSGVSMGILENGHPSEYVEANIESTRYFSDWTQHATVVTECAASTDVDLPGTGHYADIYAADNWDNEQADSFISWFSLNDVGIINCSMYWQNYSPGDPCDRNFLESDLNYEEAVFSHNVNFIGIAGNNDDDPCNNSNVVSPHKTFNGITVGSIFDENTGDDRTDDSISDFSCHINPRTRNADSISYPHQKPEVAAVGESIDTPYNTLNEGDQNDDSVGEVQQVIEEGDGYGSSEGTSYASPNVAGFVAVLEHSFGGIANSPDTAKAVAMASANHDIGSSNRDKIGAGCVDVDEGVSILFGKQYITDTFYKENNSQDYTIDLEAGDIVDIALVWRSDATQAQFSNIADVQSDINLLLNFYDPDGNLIAYDGANDRAWQFIDGEDENLTNGINETGSYGIKIWNDRWDADESNREFTIAWRIY